MINTHSVIFVGIFTLLLLLFSNISHINNLEAFAQHPIYSSIASTVSKSFGGLKIISPERGSLVPINSNTPFIVKGISKDNSTSNCKVYIIINSVKPYQPVQPMNIAGKEDYTSWQYILLKNYTHLVTGPNKITSKSSCLNTPQNLYYSINVTGMNFSPEQLKKYSSVTTSTTTTKNIRANISTNPHPIAEQIQKIKENARNNPLFTGNKLNTTIQAQKINPISINPSPSIKNSISTTTKSISSANQSNKSSTPSATAPTTTTTSHDVKHSKHSHNDKKVSKHSKHKHSKHIDKKTRDNSRDNIDKKTRDNSRDNIDKKTRDNSRDNGNNGDNKQWR